LETDWETRITIRKENTRLIGIRGRDFIRGDKKSLTRYDEKRRYGERGEGRGGVGWGWGRGHQ
jgi:hypothetical protein